MADPNNWWESDPVVTAAPQARQGVIIPVKPEPTEGSIPSGYRKGPDGTLEVIPGGPADKPDASSKPTEAQQKTATLLTRIKGGFNDIQAIIADNEEAQEPGLGETIATGIFGEGLVSRKIAGEDRRIVRDSQRDILDALLTLGTGAAYNAEQLEGQLQSYFPQYGDTQNEIKVKNDRMMRLIESAKQAAGPQWGDVETAIAPFMADIPSGGTGPDITVTPEESAAVFGEVRYDEKGNIVGENYQGTIYDAQGNDQGLAGSVTEYVGPDGSAGSFTGDVLSGLTEAFTGSERSTPEIEALPDWTEMPADFFDLGTFKTAIGTLFGGSPEEIAQIVQNNNPGVRVRQDRKGNFILVAPDGKEYGIKPGFRGSDAPRAIGTALAYTPAGRVSGIGRAALAEGATQAGIEAMQAGTGGTFNPADVATAAAGGALFKGAERGIGAIRPRGDGGIVPPSAPMTAPPMTGGGGGMPSSAPPITPTAPNTVGAALMSETGATFSPRSAAGAMQVSEETIRSQRAAELPVPVELARFQRTRDFAEQQRARELAKSNEVGSPIRERLAQQQEALRQNFDAFIDATGSEVWENAREKGVVVDQALRKLANVGKTRIRVLYKRAEKAGEMQEPVSYQGLLDFINEQTPTTRDQLAPVLKAVQEQLSKNDPNGTGAIPINALEDVRKLINQTAQPGTPNAAFGGEMKGIIDAMTEGKGGELYQKARQARIDYANTFENAGLVRQLIGTKANSTDRAIALENVAEKAIYSRGTSLDDLKNLKGVLDQAGTRGEKAWKELQGATVEHIRDQAYKGITRDESGQVVISPVALNRAISSLDASGKLDFVFGKKTAELFRSLNSVAQDMFTAPPGSVNASNTSSAFMNAIDTIASYSATGLPVPIVKIFGNFREALKTRELRKEVKRLLD